MKVPFKKKTHSTKKSSSAPRPARERQIIRPKGAERTEPVRPLKPAPLRKTTLAVWQKLCTEFNKAPLGEAGILGLAQKYKRSCMRLWEGFTGHKPIPRDYLSRDEYRIAYLLGFHLINSARLEVLLERLSGERGIRLPQQPVSMWDFGSGTGAITTTLLDFLEKQRLPLADIHLCDRSTAVLSSVEAALTATLPAKKLQGSIYRHTSFFAPGEVNFAQLASNQTHIFSFGYVLNELDEKGRDAMVLWMTKVARSPAPALVLIVDSSDEEICRGMMDFRDEITEKGMVPVYPCPHTVACPLGGSKDWCYTEARWQLPEVQQKIDEIIEHPRRTMTMSAYAFANRSFLSAQKTKDLQKKVLVGKPTDKYRKNLQIPVYCLPNGEIEKELKSAEPRIRGMRGSAVRPRNFPQRKPTSKQN